MSSDASLQNSLAHFSDIGALWEAALDRYERVSGVRVQMLGGSNNLDAVLAQVHERSVSFEKYRHNNSKIDKFRSLVKESLEPILTLGEVVVNATKQVRYILTT